MKPVVAIASEFLDAFARIPRAQQRKVREFTEKFRENPTSAAINYEKINMARDDKVRTVRIGAEYRAVALHPEQGNMYMLLWVDHHDEAMAWARNRLFDINPVTGSLQIVNVVDAEKTSARHGKTKGLFADTSDDDLASLGVPRILLPAVRAIMDKDALSALGKHLPAEAAEALMWLAEGFDFGEVKAAVAAPKEKAPIDTRDFIKALDHPDSRRRFVTVNTQHDLNAILNAPLEKWRVFLHPTQERLVRRDFSGPAKVTGGAGTGKTVVAMHRARHLAWEVFPESTDRVLVTTFTRNLARDIAQNLKHLCGEEYKRLEIVHLHDWAVKFMKTQGFEFDVATDAETTACWDRAINVTGETAWPVPFLREEWDQVVQANVLQTKQAYLVVRRTGRGKTVSRKDRAALWSIFEEYQAALRSTGKVEWNDVIRQTRQYLQDKSLLPYRAVVVDEAQDFHDEEWRLIRTLVPEGPNDLFLVGDAHQRIYGRRTVLSKCGIDVRGRSSKLRINYRTTEQIKNWALAILHGVEVDDLDGGLDDQVGYTSLLSGPVPTVQRFAFLAEEQKAIGKLLLELLKDHKPEDICVVARTRKLITKDYAPALEQAGIPCAVLDKDGGEEQSGVRLATMHRVKGLEFSCMIIAGVNAGVIPYERRGIEDDPVARQEHDQRERCLLFVAATRSRDSLTITSSGKPSPYLELFE